MGEAGVPVGGDPLAEQVTRGPTGGLPESLAAWMSDQVLAFVLVAIPVLPVPGPDILLVLRNTTVGGRRIGGATAADVCIGSRFTQPLLPWAVGVAGHVRGSVHRREGRRRGLPGPSRGPVTPDRLQSLQRRHSRVRGRSRLERGPLPDARPRSRRAHQHVEPEGGGGLPGVPAAVHHPWVLNDRADAAAGRQLHRHDGDLAYRRRDGRLRPPSGWCSGRPSGVASMRSPVWCSSASPAGWQLHVRRGPSSGHVCEPI